jgi:hypothetical protein
MRVCIILYAFLTCTHCKHRHPCIMVYTSFGQYHGNCIVSYTPFRSCMKSSILMLHHHNNHTSQQCITFMVIYRALHSELEHFIINPWLHRYKWTCFTINIIQNIQIINSEQEYFKHDVSISRVILTCYPWVLWWMSPTFIILMLWS